jgi:hypothetical protein
MSARALITVIDSRQQRCFYQDHGSPQLQIPRLAGFVGWADAHAVPLTAARLPDVHRPPTLRGIRSRAWTRRRATSLLRTF